MTLNVQRFQDAEQFIELRYLFMLRGFILLTLGGLAALMSVLSPGTRMMAENNAWLPMAAFLMVFSGVMGMLDARTSVRKEAILLHAQLAILDLLAGIIVLAELDNDASKLTLLLALYLMSRSLFRILTALTIHFPHSRTVIISALLGFMLGFMIWIEWPYFSIGFVSFAVCLELAFRGWTLLVLGLWLRKQKASQNLADHSVEQV